MKLDRLIGIITTLQQKGRVTAPYLAEKFEVSRRTINRDIEAICRAGIPIAAQQGRNGGISIMEGFSFDTTVFTEEEMQAILAGLKSLDSVSDSPKLRLLTDKIGGVIPVSENMIIDLASFYKDDLSEKISLLKKAISEHKQVKFRYCYSKGEKDKLIEPALIVFKWTSWYIFGYSQERSDFRMYKLNRLWDLEITDKSFVPKEIPEAKMNFDSHITNEITVKAIFDKSEKYRLIEEYGPYCFKMSEDGNLYTEIGFCSPENAMPWYLSFGSRVRILSPEDFRTAYIGELEKAVKRHLGDT